MYNIRLLNKLSEQGIVLFDKNKYAVSDKCENPDAIIVRSASMHDMPVPSALRAVARAGAGYNNIPVDTYTERGIVVFNTPGANANAVKELLIAALMLASRDISGGINWARSLSGKSADVAKDVEGGKSAFVGPEITGKTLGVIGLGAVGALSANAAAALGMDVYGHDPYITVDSAWSLSWDVKKAAELKTIYEKADYIALHAPVTNETKKMINKDSISQMKDGVRIINMSRADLVDDDDMAAALESGKVACYITDFPNEKVLSMKNAIPIPHLGASTPESEENCAVMAARQIIDFLENGNIRNSVNFPNIMLDRSGETRICIIHKNIPNMISQITAVFGKNDINIENMLNKSRGNYAYTICDIVNSVPDSIVSELEKVDGIIRAVKY